MAIEIRDVRCSYGMVDALRGVSFEVERGDFVGIIGPNGSGKSTLLRAMSRVLKPEGGVVLLDGRDIWSFRSREMARRVAVVPQETMISFSFTAEEIILMGRTPYLGRFDVEGVKDREIARRAMELTDVTHLAGRFITEVSSGERQRVIIARALAQEPEILLLDEPISHLDLCYQAEILGLVRRLNREQGLTVVIVLHDLNLACEHCNALVMLKDGRIFAVGKPEHIVTRDNIKAVYDADVLVGCHPVFGCPHVMSLPM